ncbi:flavin monoamine oxidase family protein [Natribacillus halophilus]|uniref:Monoamine oxidase n=1 Tax=Natribacillus halophilus TaxID=549003 RepID=A0A1G8QN87_9BACI|nr:FAD-dependent oxidoreductase [Natribacillus halophilus]SDJ06103.1 Monoamine oxidase [Natribacillus halophilus]
MQQTKAQNMYDVVIVGAGLAGMVAAKMLNEKNINYKVIEASHRSGGKVITAERKDHSRFFELGAQFVNEDMTEIVSFIESAGMELQETDVNEKSMDITAPTRKALGKCVTDVQHEMIKATGEQDERLSDLYERVITDEELKKVISSIHAELLNIEPSRLSAKVLTDMHERYPSEKSDLTHQASGPLSHLISFLEKNLDGKIVYNEPLRQVNETKEGYTLITDNDQYRANAVIMALPPAVASHFSYSSNLEQYYRQALNSYTDGAIIKTTWVFQNAFWHYYAIDGETKHVGGIVFTDPQGITVADSSKIGDAEVRLTMFIGAGLARNLAKEDEIQRKEIATELLEKVFGEQARTYVDMEQSVWVDHPYCGGGYGASVHYRGVDTAADVLREPYNLFVFASSELAESFPSFMEGAVRSGQYAAKQILKRI